MQTKFSIGDTVFIKAKVTQIQIDKNGVSYLVRPTEMHNVGNPWIHLEQEINETDLLEAEE